VFCLRIGLIDIPSVPFVQPKYFERLNRLKCELEDVWAETKGASVINYTKKTFSIGLLTLSTYLKTNIKGIKIDYCNYLDLNKINSNIKKYDYIGITAKSPFLSIVLNIAKNIKKSNPNIKVVIGGSGPTNDPKTYLKSKFVDFVVLEEGEISFLKLLTSKPLSKINGIGYKQKDRIVINKSITYLGNERIPTSDYSLFDDDLNNYNINITYMRGCLYNCAFCAKFQGPIRFRKTTDIIAELKFLNKHLLPNTPIHFSDNIICIDVNRFVKLMNAIIKSNLNNLYFVCDLRANHTTPEIVRKLDEANFKLINLGVEDCNDSVLHKNNKQLSYSQMKEAMQIIRDNSNALIGVYWMIALPGTTNKTINQNLNEIKRLILTKQVDFILPSLFKPYPGSAISNNPKKYGIKMVNSWDEWLLNYYLPLWTSNQFNVTDLSNLNKKYLKVIIDTYKERCTKKYVKDVSFKNTIGL